MKTTKITKKQEIANLLKKLKFEEEEGGSVFLNYELNMDFVFNEKINKWEMNFSHHIGGLLRVINPTIEEIKSLINIHKKAKYIEMSTERIRMKEMYGFILADGLKQFMASKCDDWKSDLEEAVK